MHWVLVMPRDRTDIVTSARNPRVIAARKLEHRKSRHRQGRFLVEGLQLLHMGLDAGAHALEVFHCEHLTRGGEADRLLARFRRAGADLVAVSPLVMQALSRRDTPSRIAATFSLRETPVGDLDLGRDGLVVVLDRLHSPANLGVIIRTADAVGAAAVVMIDPCADPHDPVAVRGSMGSLFNVPLMRVADAPVFFARLTAHAVGIVGADPHCGVCWGEGVWGRRTALVLGNEARGLSDDVRAQIGAWARLPMIGKADSLNVAVAGSALMYAWLQARLSG